MSLVTPDAVYTDSPLTKPEECAICGEHYQAGPEGVGWSLANHCWKCGHVWGQEFDPNAVSARVNWARMQNMVSAAIAEAMNSPQQAAINEWLKTHTAADLQALQDAEAAKTTSG